MRASFWLQISFTFISAYQLLSLYSLPYQLGFFFFFFFTFFLRRHHKWKYIDASNYERSDSKYSSFLYVFSDFIPDKIGVSVIRLSFIIRVEEIHVYRRWHGTWRQGYGSRLSLWHGWCPVKSLCIWKIALKGTFVACLGLVWDTSLNYQACVWRFGAWN